MPDNIEIAQTVLSALNRLDSKFDIRFDNISGRFDSFKEVLDDLKESDAKLSERVTTVEGWRSSYQRDVDRWWGQTWPNHEKVISSLEERLRISEQSSATAKKLDDIEVRLRDVESAKQAVTKVEAMEEDITALKEFKASATVKLAIILGSSTLIGSGVVTLLFKLLFH